MPASGAELFKKIKPAEIKQCPFTNLPEWSSLVNKSMASGTSKITDFA
jgi:hypothetical protein